MNNLKAYISGGAKYFSIALLLPLFSTLNSCKDNPGNLNSNILPKSDVISAYQTDTAQVVTSMFLKDSALSESVNPCLLGSYNDPVFGEMKSSIYAEAFPQTTIPAPAFAVNCTVDSAVLMLQILPQFYYGGSDPQTFMVYKTDTDVNTAIYAYSNNSIKYNPSPIGIKQNALPNPFINDTLRIPLNKSWWSTFVNQIELNYSYWNSGNLNQILHGLYITTSTPLQLPGQGSLINLNIINGDNAIYFWYHSNSSPQTESYTTIPIGTNYAYFIHYDHNYATTALGALHPIGTHDSVDAGQLMYTEAMGGVVGRVNFPNLYKNWSKLGPIIVNEAILNLPADPSYAQTITGAEFTSGPPNLNLFATNDTTWEGYGLVDPLSQNISMSNYAYTFNITQYIQSVINGKTLDKGLYVKANSYETTANGVVLYGAKHSTQSANRATLTIYYTPVTSAKNP